MKVLLLLARGLRAGALGCYGNEWVRTPALDALAAGAVVFDGHLADHPDPAGARRAWRSGCYQLPAGPAPAFEPPDLFRSLTENGVVTRLVLDDGRPAPPEARAGWAKVRAVRGSEELAAAEAAVEAGQAALKRLAGRDGWLLGVDLGTVLPPWEAPDDFLAPYFPPEEEDEEAEVEPLTPLLEPAEGPIDPEDDDLFLRLQGSYAAAVSYLDAAVGELLEAADEDVAVLLTADAGYPLGEHGVVGPAGAGLHGEVLHLPLLLRLPGARGGRRVAGLTQSVDLAPTLAALFGVPLPGAQGHSLLPLARGEVEGVRPYACAGLQVGAGVEWALRTPEWAFLLSPEGGEDRKPRLYAKPDDVWEVNDVAQHRPDLAEALEGTLRAFVAATARPGPLEAPALTL